MAKNMIKIEMEKMGIEENVVDNIMKFHGDRVTHRDFRNGYYIYKNDLQKQNMFLIQNESSNA